MADISALYIDEAADGYDPRSVLRGIDPETDAAVFSPVKFHELDLSGRLGAEVTSTTQMTVALGTFTFGCDADPIKHKVGDDVEIISMDEAKPGAITGILVAKGGTSEDPTMTLVVNEVPDAMSGLTISLWRLVVWQRARAFLEVDVSTTGINPTSAGPFTLTVTAGKLFDLPAGTVQLRSIAKPHITILTSIKAYSGTSLVLNKIATNSAVSETLSAWDVFLIDAPPKGIPLGQVTGLRLSFASTIYTVTNGAIRDDKDAVDLVLNEATGSNTKNLNDFADGGGGSTTGGIIKSADLAGTVTNSAVSPDVTGTGTAFLTDFKVGSTIHLGNDGVGYTVASVADDTHLTTVRNIVLAHTGAAYRRGGKPFGNGTGDNYLEWIVVRKDATGYVEHGLASFNAADEIDTPSGWTFKQKVGRAFFDAGGSSANIISLQREGGQESSVVLASGKLAAAASHNLFFPQPFDEFKKIVLRLRNMLVSTDAAEVNLRLSQDGSTFLSGAADYGWVHYDDDPLTSGVGEVLAFDNSDSEIEMLLNVGNLASEGADIEIEFLNPIASARLNGCKWAGRFVNSTPRYVDVRGKGLIRSGAGAIYGAQILASTGNVSLDYEIVGHR